MIEDGERWDPPITAELRRKRAAKCGSLFLRLDWGTDVAKGLVAAGAPYAVRLWLVVKLQTGMGNPRGGWIVPRKVLLETLGLARPQYLSAAIAKLEARGLIQVRRSPGKRTEVRLVAAARKLRSAKA